MINNSDQFIPSKPLITLLATFGNAMTGSTDFTEGDTVFVRYAPISNDPPFNQMTFATNKNNSLVGTRTAITIIGDDCNMFEGTPIYDPECKALCLYNDVLIHKFTNGYLSIIKGRIKFKPISSSDRITPAEMEINSLFDCNIF